MEDNSHAGQGAVVLDIGGHIGALVVSAPPHMNGIEIEIRPAGDPLTTHAPHVAVTGRPTNTGLDYTLVFPELHEGAYQLNERHHDAVALIAFVQGGTVTYTTWPTFPTQLVDGVSDGAVQPPQSSVAQSRSG